MTMIPRFEYGILHNRKTAGTALKHIIEQQKKRNPELPVKCFGHALTFSQFVKQYPSAKVIFFIRDPIAKFISGFYSRLRQGKPRYHFPWSSAETKAFAHFETPNQLAEALSAHFLKQYFAKKAMHSIAHVKHTLVDFLGPLSFLQKHSQRIAYIGHQPNFTFDLKVLRTLLTIDADIVEPHDDVIAHRNPQDVDKHLSEIALRNLQKWYKYDFEIYRWCLEQRRKLIEKCC